MWRTAPQEEIEISFVVFNLNWVRRDRISPLLRLKVFQIIWFSLRIDWKDGVVRSQDAKHSKKQDWRLI